MILIRFQFKRGFPQNTVLPASASTSQYIIVEEISVPPNRTEANRNFLPVIGFYKFVQLDGSSLNVIKTLE